MRILMVCLGNICRSPMADGLLRKKVKALNLDVTVDSAGTSAAHQGEHPDQRMRHTARELGTPIDELQSRPFVSEDFDRFDIIYAMDKENRRNILSLARSEDDKLKVLLILNEVEPGMDLEVPDPYYGGQQGFIDVYQMLDRATDKIIERLFTNA
jgi:protein-tyrosine phosphatase